jgi:predicted transcriptional regulator
MTLKDAFDGFPTSRTLLVTVESTERFYQDGLEAIERLERGESIDEPDTFSFTSVEQLFETFNALTMELPGTIAEEQPSSIRVTVRLLARDVKNVHDELTRLERSGGIRVEQEGRSKRPVFPYEEVVITVPFDRDDTADVAAVSEG